MYWFCFVFLLFFVVFSKNISIYNIRAHSLFGCSLSRVCFFKNALEMFERASLASPESAATHYAVAVVMKALRLNNTLATERLRRAHELEPATHEFGNTYAHSLKALADWRTLRPLWARLRPQVERGERPWHPFSALMFDLPLGVLLRESRRAAAEAEAEAARFGLELDVMSRYKGFAFALHRSLHSYS